MVTPAAMRVAVPGGEDEHHRGDQQRLAGPDRGRQPDTERGGHRAGRGAEARHAGVRPDQLPAIR